MTRRWSTARAIPDRAERYAGGHLLGEVLRRTTPGALSEYLGLTVENVPDRCVDLVMVGGGPAGLAAAVYGASEGLRTIGWR